MLLNNQMKRKSPRTMTSELSTSNEVFYLDDPMPSTSKIDVGNDNIKKFVDHLIDEICVNNKKPQINTNGHDENKDPQMQLFYEDKNSAFKFSEIPKYTTKEFSTIQTAKEKVNGAACSSSVIEDIKKKLLVVENQCLELPKQKFLKSAAIEKIHNYHLRGDMTDESMKSLKKNRKRRCRRGKISKARKQLKWKKLQALHGTSVGDRKKNLQFNVKPVDNIPSLMKIKLPSPQINVVPIETTSKTTGKLTWDNLLAQHSLCVQNRYQNPSQIAETPQSNKSPVHNIPSLMKIKLPSPQINEVRKETTRKVKRVIIIDGSNVAMAARKEFDRDSHMDYCVEGLKKCIDNFENLGFEAKAVVPEYRMRRENSSNWALINELKTQGKVVCSPSKSHDHRVILNAAIKLDAAIVSNDLFRDLANENTDYRKVIQSRVIRFMWLFDQIFIAEDPYGRHGPKLEEILYRTEKVV